MFGYGGVSFVPRASGLSRTTIHAGQTDSESFDLQDFDVIDRGPRVISANSLSHQRRSAIAIQSPPADWLEVSAWLL